MNSGKRTIMHILFLVAVLATEIIAVTPTKAICPPDDTEQKLRVKDTVVERIIPRPEADSMSTARYYSEIHFRLNKADLDISYMDNGQSLLRLERIIDSLGIDNIVSVGIISQSSPEGSLDRNTWLTEHRSKAMLNYMNRVYPELKDKLSMSKIIEAWDNLASYVIQDPYLEESTKEKILGIINSDKLSVADKKLKLKNSLGKDPNTGDVYSYLTKYYYPVIRNSSIFIFHIKFEPDQQQEPAVPYLEETPPDFAEITYTPQQPSLDFEDFRKRPLIAVKTNLVYDAFFTKDLGWAPIGNIELELYPTEEGRWTWLAEYEFPWYSVPSKHQYFQIQNWQLEGRRYFKKASNHSGHYLSAYIGANYYDICFDSKDGNGYQGEGGGLGLGYGYVLPLGKKPDTKWKLEFFIKWGVYVTFYDPYDAGTPFAGKYYYLWDKDPSLFIKRNNVYRWLFLPTGGGISLSYDLIHKKAKKTGSLSY